MNRVDRPPQVTKQGRERLGAKLLAYRENLMFSLRDASASIAFHAGTTISPTSLGKIEQGASVPHLDTLLLLSSIGYGDLSLSEMIHLLTEVPQCVADSQS